MHKILKKHCTKEWLEFINYHCDIQLYKKGESIFNIGDQTKGLYLINYGKVKVLTSNGETQRIIRLASDGDILGHRGFGGTWTYSITAIALDDTELTFLPINIFNQIVKGNPELGYFMVMFFAEELRDSERLARLTQVKNGVSSVLYQCYKTFGLEKENKTLLEYTLSRKDIANKAGVSYESVVRTLSDLNKEKIIKIDGKNIHILDLKLLRELAKGN